MSKVIKDFAKFNDNMQEEIYALFSEGSLERATFPFKGEITDGVIYQMDEFTYLIPTNSIKSSKMASSNDEDEDEDRDMDDVDIEENDLDDEE
ncbi:MAG: hypothetical protein ACO2Z9_01640 [Crocinitomicaceae bacterium]